MLEEHALHQHIDTRRLEWLLLPAVVTMLVVGEDVLTHLLLNLVFKGFLILYGFIQTVLDIIKHLKVL